MPLIVLIRAGSHVFSRHSVTDVLTHPELRYRTITQMNIPAQALGMITDL
jgi:alpha-galactosidase/6-phospho-beta-glucosidase family protein